MSLDSDHSTCIVYSAIPGLPRTRARCGRLARDPTYEFDTAIYGTAVAGLIPLGLLVILWDWHLAPAHNVRDMYLSEGVRFDPHALSLYLAAPGAYLLPLVVSVARKASPMSRAERASSMSVRLLCFRDWPRPGGVRVRQVWSEPDEKSGRSQTKSRVAQTDRGAHQVSPRSPLAHAVRCTRKILGAAVTLSGNSVREAPVIDCKNHQDALQPPTQPNTLRICLARPLARGDRPHACRGGVGVRIERPHCAEHADSGSRAPPASWRRRDGADDLHAA